MIVKYKAKSLFPDEYSDNTFMVEQVNTCPICKKSISPVHLNSVFRYHYKYEYDEFTEVYIESHLLCKGCYHSFIASYCCEYNHNNIQIGTLISVEPNKYEKYVFDDNIVKLSPQFDKIYNQALAAEARGLDEIAGLGYRKSLEFLVKDFAIHQHPSEAEDIKKQMLSPCIKKYIDNPQIKTLVERSAWIGNDEAHYIRKQADRDVNDMKAFIKATVYFIGMVLITEDAESMEPK